MIYKDSKGNNISTISEWKSTLFAGTKKKKHWKKGRSAFELANFMINGIGENVISDLVAELLNEKVSFDYAIPEMEVRFDQFGHGREHDLGIWGNTESKKKIFIGVEAKVDESFNKKISESYIKAKANELSGISTNTAKRIESLLKRNFREIKPEFFDLRYQLLYSTVGTLDTKGADLYVLLVIVFKSDLYDEIKGLENYKDYIQFVNSVDSERIKSKKGIDYHKLKIENKTLHSIYLNIEN
ncbi:MAG: hypothetical protein PHR53_08735 [Bacteroidales bacterium]|nr:hypothetical protein [Bacteroidales bacterium]